MRRRTFLGATCAAVAGCTSRGGDGAGSTVRVPGDRATVQAAVDAAERGDLVLVDAGTYHESVTVETPEITLRGRDRNAVVLDGGFERTNGIDVEADGVAVENLTVRRYRHNGVYWDGVRGFRASFVTAHTNGFYGVYATHSRDGRFEFSYASGHADAGFYLGRNRPFEAVVANVVAEHNAMGYSGTSTGAELTIRDSVFRHNVVGIAPNTLDRADPPQRASRIVGNHVYANHNANAPAVEHTYPPFGTGIVLWGGSDNVVEDNVVDAHENFGIALARNVAEPSGNAVRGNVVRASGVADLALGAPTGAGNEFADNLFATSAPAGLEDAADAGDERVTRVFDEQRRAAEEGEVPGGSYREQPRPGPQPAMPEPTAAPRPADKETSWAD